jgi:peptidoglycan/LPS O-acetylase OafA/YrhL
MPVPKRNLPFDILDSIRGIAALYVTVAHCRGTLWIGGNEFSRMFPYETWSIWEYIMIGSSMLTRLAVEFVIVFFLLSGFSIAHSLADNKSPRPFYKRRLIRIYPSYVAALVWAGLIFVVTRLLFPEWYDGSMDQFAFLRTTQMNNYLEGEVIVKNLLYMPSAGFITPFWSLTYEVIFYLMAPFLLRRTNLYAVISLLFFITGILAPAFIDSLGLHVYIHDFLFVYNIYFVAGVLLYKYFDTVTEWFSAISQRAHLVIILVAASLMYGINFYLQTESSYSFIAAAAFSFVLIFYFLKYMTRIPWLINIGKFSYTLYITHLASIFLYLAIYWMIFQPKNPYILNYSVWIPAVLL